MKNWRSHFVFNRSQQNGIFVLVVIIIVLQLFYFFYPFSSEGEENFEDVKLAIEMQHSVDSLKVAAEKDTGVLVSFNPNFISDYKGYMLGLSLAEIDRLHQYREKDLWVNSAEEFQEVTGVSDSLLKIIAPSFKFPDFNEKFSEENKVSKMSFLTPLSKADLNTATAEDLQQVNGIGEKLSARIVNYRNSLGGFRAGLQLKDVYGLSPEVVERALKRFEVQTMTGEMLDINEVSLMQLTELPFFNYEQARALIRYREEVEEIKSMEELQQIKNFPFEKLDRIALYLTINQEN